MTVALGDSVLLPSDALAGVHLGISTSESPDLARLGLLDEHLRLALGELARAILVSSGSIVYGGHLNTDGYTAFLLSELRRYGRRDRPLKVVLAWSEHRRVKLSFLQNWIDELGLLGSITCLDLDGRTTDPTMNRGEEPVQVDEPSSVAIGLTAMRVYSSGIIEGRILLGGRRTGFLGDMPGLMEETLIALKSNQPLYLAGGFGGITLDIVRAVIPEAATWLPAATDAPSPDERCSTGLVRIAEIAQGRGSKALANGLREDENLRLAATHRPSEIAALVSLGIGRLAGQGAFRKAH